MSAYRFSLHVAAPQHRVFELWTDLDRMAEWIGGVTKVTRRIGEIDDWALVRVGSGRRADGHDRGRAEDEQAGKSKGREAWHSGPRKKPLWMTRAYRGIAGPRMLRKS